MRPPKIVKEAVVYGVGIGLFAASWVLLGALALGNKYISPIPRNRPKKGEYI